MSLNIEGVTEVPRGDLVDYRYTVILTSTSNNTFTTILNSILIIMKGKNYFQEDKNIV